MTLVKGVNYLFLVALIVLSMPTSAMEPKPLVSDYLEADAAEIATENLVETTELKNGDDYLFILPVEGRKPLLVFGKLLIMDVGQQVFILTDSQGRSFVLPNGKGQLFSPKAGNLRYARFTPKQRQQLEHASHSSIDEANFSSIDSLAEASSSTLLTKAESAEISDNLSRYRRYEALTTALNNLEGGSVSLWVISGWFTAMAGIGYWIPLSEHNSSFLGSVLGMNLFSEHSPDIRHRKRRLVKLLVASAIVLGVHFGWEAFLGPMESLGGKGNIDWVDISVGVTTWATVLSSQLWAEYGVEKPKNLLRKALQTFRCRKSLSKGNE